MKPRQISLTVQSVLNVAAELIYGREPFGHVSDLMQDGLLWLHPAADRLQVRLLAYNA